MLRSLVPVLIALFFVQISFTSSQSCIRNEVRAALQELENRSQPSISFPSNRCANTSDAQFQELNNTMQQGLQEIRQLQENQQSIEEKLQGIERLLSTILSLHYSPGSSPTHPAQSCKEIYDRNTSSPSGYYWLESSSEQTIQVYCDMERTCGGVQGGWMKVISMNASKTTDSCPSGLRKLTSPQKLCTKNVHQHICSATTLHTHGVQYSQVCGKIIGYQYNSPDAFGPYFINRALTIDDGYVDGISLTHGRNPRKHIWTFAAALHEVTSSFPNFICPCTNVHNHVTIPIPPYVGNDYFCDTASKQRFEFKFYPDDPLWDGQGCGRLNTCCSFNNPPWFMKQLPTSTSDSIEMRLCSDQSSKIVFETLDLYVR